MYYLVQSTKTDWNYFRKAHTSDFVETTYIYVFWRAGYEYNYENSRKFNFHGENHEKLIKFMVFCFFF